MLYDGVKFSDSKLDRRLLYEESWFKYRDEEEDYDFSDVSDPNSSDSASQSATSPNGLNSAFKYN